MTKRSFSVASVVRFGGLAIGSLIFSAVEPFLVCTRDVNAGELSQSVLKLRDL